MIIIPTIDIMFNLVNILFISKLNLFNIYSILYSFIYVSIILGL